MVFTLSQKKTAYKKLSKDVQDFIMDSETTDLIEKYLVEVGLSAEQSDSADTEILNAMYGLQTFSEAMANIAKLSNKKVEELSKLRADLENNIFSKIPKNQAPTANSGGEEVFSLSKKSQIVAWGEKNVTGNNPQLNDKIKKLDIAKRTRGALEINDKNSIPEYVKNLSRQVQDLVFDKAWSERTKEIARKYSLDPTQTDTLTNNVLFVLVGLDKPEDFLKLMTSELGISRLLADQIIEDLEMRIFDYATRTVENKEKRSPTPTPSEATKPKIFETPKPTIEKTKVPEIKPMSLPMVAKPSVNTDGRPTQTESGFREKGEVAHNIPPLSKPIVSPTYKPTFIEQNKLKVPENKEASRITYTPNNTDKEQIQRPVSVPRFTGIKIEEKPEDIKPVEPITKPTPQDIMNSKLNVAPEKVPEKPTEPLKTETPTPPAHKYAVDPYREPME